MKLLIRHRHSLAMAQFKYNQSLRSVATVIRAFQREKQSKFLITEPIPEKKTEEEEEEENSDGDRREICSHFYDNNNSMGAPLMQTAEGNGDFGWDFFNLFDGVRTEVVNAGYGGGRPGATDDKQKKAVVAGNADVDRGVVESGKELFDELKEVEESFVKGFECGEEVSRMLEIGGVHHLDHGLHKFPESPMKSPFLSPMKSHFHCSPMKSPFQSIVWGRSASSSSSSCKSSFAFSSPCSSTWTEINDVCFNEHKGMVSGSHSLTLGRLYAWENKLYEEVKAGEYVRKIYEQKCLQLKNQDAKCKGGHSPEKIKAEARDLHSRILVAVRCIESISQRIEKVRDEELQPQLIELLYGLMSTWKTMLETHKSQKQAILEVKKFTHKNFTELSNNSHHLATFQLATEVQNWSFCFAEYLSTQKAYAKALHDWLSTFISPHSKSHNRGRSSSLPSVDDPPSILITREWLNLLVNLPDKPVMGAMRSFSKDMRALWSQQGDEQLHKRKVNGLIKDHDRSVNALKREEEKGTEKSMFSGGKTEENVGYRVDYLNQRKRLVDNLRKKLEIEKEKHRDNMEETERMTLRVFQKGFGSVFDALVEFSKASLQMYADVLKSESKVHK